jgi:hypothetical protein
LPGASMKVVLVSTGSCDGIFDANNGRMLSLMLFHARLDLFKLVSDPYSRVTFVVLDVLKRANRDVANPDLHDLH